MRSILLNFFIIAIAFVCPALAQPDLILNEHALINSLKNEKSAVVILNTDQCYISEGCLDSVGYRQIIRFTTQISNIGNQDFYVGIPDDSNDLWDNNNCHGHWHYEGYAEYNLLDSEGTPTPVGFKNGFCLMDSNCDQGIEKKYISCNDQGISANCSDIYPMRLDCQWIDVTDIPDGTYKFEMKVNAFERADILGRHESNYNNNSAQACFTLTRDDNGKHFVHVIGNGSTCGGSSDAPCTSVTLNVLFDEYPQETNWEIRGTDNNVLFSGDSYNSSNASSLLSEVICLPYGCYNFTIFDSGDDGICCDFGDGFFQLADASGQQLLNGGNFGSNEINSFCLEPEEVCIDNDKDGICEDIDCDDNNAGVPAPAGAACDDNDPLTSHDEIGPGGCTCIGIAVDENCPHQLQLGLQFDLYPSETAWEIQDAESTIVAEANFYLNVPSHSFIIESFCLPSGCYKLIMKDDFGDGMCCNFQGGHYALTDAEGTVLAEGDSFGDEEVSNFCITSCEEFLYITDTLNNTKVHYKANQTIFGNSIISGNNSNVVFDAGRVILDNGFNVEANVAFKIRNGGCSN